MTTGTEEASISTRRRPRTGMVEVDPNSAINPLNAAIPRPEDEAAKGTAITPQTDFHGAFPIVAGADTFITRQKEVQGANQTAEPKTVEQVQHEGLSFTIERR